MNIADKKVLNGDVAERVRELVRETCEAFEIRIVRGVVSKDRTYSVSCLPTIWRQARL